MNKEQRMLERIPEIYARLVEMRAIAQADARTLEQLQNAMDDILNQSFIDTATWGLRDWERGLDIVPYDMDYAIRRKNIKNKLSNIYPASGNVIEHEINRYLANPSSKVEMIKGEYAFNVIIHAEDLITGVEKLDDVIEQIKPAHLSHIIKQKLLVSLNIGSAALFGETITVYPWNQSKELVTRGTERVGMTYQSMESISVYPKRSV